MAKMTSAIAKLLYPIVAKMMPSKVSAFKRCISKFVDNRTEQLFATGPLHRMTYGAFEADEMFNAVGIDRLTVKRAISQTFYWEIPAYNPRYAKDELTILLLTIIRYFYLKKDMKNVELATMYLSFTGKFYPSIHYAMFPVVEPSKYPHVMDYVVNNLSLKFDLKRTGSVIGAVKSINQSWIAAYGKEFKEYEDDDVSYLVQQLHQRIKAFIKNIAILYYKAYENKDYIVLNSDNQTEEEIQLADSDVLQAEKAIERAMSKIQSMNVDYGYCKLASGNQKDALVKTEEVKQIIESILNDKKNIGTVKELVKLLVYTYFAQSKSKLVSDIAFITFSITPKPNTKDKYLLRIKDITTTWLDTYSERYRARKKRLATQNAYIKAVLMYFTLIIHTANK